jgi:hypothetical protein
VPLAPPTPHARPLVSFSHFISPAQQPLSLSRGALGFGDGDRRSWIPEVSSPPLPSPLSPSSSPYPSLPYTRPPSYPLRARPLQPLRVAPCGPGTRPSAPGGVPLGVAAPSPSRAAPLALPTVAPPSPGGAVHAHPRDGLGPPAARPAPAPSPTAASASAPATRPAPAPPTAASGAAPWPPRAWPLAPLRAAVPAPVRGPCPLQHGPPARFLARPGAARVASARRARPRTPRSPNAFPHAQPHAHGDLFLVFN